LWQSHHSKLSNTATQHNTEKQLQYRGVPKIASMHPYAYNKKILFLTNPVNDIIQRFSYTSFKVDYVNLQNH